MISSVSYQWGASSKSEFADSYRRRAKKSVALAGKADPFSTTGSPGSLSKALLKGPCSDFFQGIYVHPNQCDSDSWPHLAMVPVNR